MLPNPYADKYKIVVKDLLTWSKWASNPIKYDGRAQGVSHMFMTCEQNYNILLYLQNHDKVIEIIKERNPIAGTPFFAIPDSKSQAFNEAINSHKDLTELLDDAEPIPDDNKYYFINIKPEFEEFANKLLQNISVPFVDSKIRESSKISYKASSGMLSINNIKLYFDSKTLHGRILMHVTRRRNVAVGKIRIEDDYLKVNNMIGSTVTEKNFKKAVDAINQKIMRNVHIDTHFLNKKGERILINPSFLTQINK